MVRLEDGRSETHRRVRGIHESQMRCGLDRLWRISVFEEEAAADYCESSAVGEAALRLD